MIHFVPFSRFLRHVPVVYVDYPGQQSLIQIYGTFNRAMLKLVPNIRALADPLTSAMVEVYLASQVIGFREREREKEREREGAREAGRERI